MKTSAAMLAYRAATTLAAPVMPYFLRRRMARGKEDAARLHERLGHPALPRPAGGLVWVHAASVGELMSVLALIETLAHSGRFVLVTTGTVTSAEIAAQRLPAGTLHQYAPIDTPGAARRFIAHWRPDAAIFVESELWPNLLREASCAGVRLAMVNGRMSARSSRRWSKIPSAIAPLLSAFDVCLAQSDGDAARLRALGATGATSPGNLKFDAGDLPVDPAALAALKSQIGARPVFIAASTHPGEDEIVIAAHLAARAQHPDLLTIIVPRHANRGADIAAVAAMAGLPARQRALGEMPDATTALYIADTMGELGLIYRLGPLAFIGRTFTVGGGQNPIEAARLHTAVLHGPDTSNFADIYTAFDDAGGAVALAGPDLLGPEVARLLSAPDQLARMQGAARDAALRLSGALERTLDALGPILPAPASRPSA